MTTCSGHLSDAVLISAALVTIVALPAYAQDPPPAVVQPGAPGQPTRTLTAEEAAALGRPSEHVEADVRFMQGMIHHHGQALDMTELLYGRTESDGMQLLAQRIDISQAGEIGMMETWLGARGEDAPTVRGEQATRLGDDERMPGMLTQQQMAQLAAATGETFDRLFLEFMIGHHEGALGMVARLFATPRAGQEQQIARFASDVDADQVIEIGRMRAMLLAKR
jgi:uncharacterized protein (DUF305 family)